MSQTEGVRGKIAAYYTGKLAEHGATPRGVDWNSPEAQTVRFDQVLKIVQAEPFSIGDIGCGYGALLDTLAQRYDAFSYRGFDLSEAMIAQARETYGCEPRAQFTDDAGELPLSDYCVASGIFSVKMDVSTSDWEQYVDATLGFLAERSQKGFAFNMLTAYSDPERMRADLYYADPHRWFDVCRQRFSRSVALLHDYGLYEFTLLVRS